LLHRPSRTMASPPGSCLAGACKASCTSS
jgi:hypothetical protein